MKSPASWITALFSTSILLQHSTALAQQTLNIAAGDYDRKDTPITFTPPRHWPTNGVLSSSAGVSIAFQTDPDGTASFVLPSLKKNARITLHLAPNPTTSTASALTKSTASRSTNALDLRLQGKPALRFQTVSTPSSSVKDRFIRAGYLHPVTSPSGRVITDDYPTNHLHHHGIWSAWTKTEFQGRHPDFWNMGDGTGRVDLQNLSSYWFGPVNAGFVANLTYTDLSAPLPTPVLQEIWTVRLFAIHDPVHPAHVFDLASTQNLTSSSPLELPEYRYGGVGFRGHRSWDGASNWIVLTSLGETDRTKAHATRPNWCYLGGIVDGAQAGIVWMGDPKNFRAPQPVRVHPTEPFFNFAPQQAGPMRIAPNTTYQSRYRCVVIDGPPNPTEIERMWTDYAHPPTVTFDAPR